MSTNRAEDPGPRGGTTGTGTPAAAATGHRARRPGHAYLLGVTAASAAFMTGAGLWALVAPRSFADFAAFPPYNEHFLHDLGAFQVGIGVTLLLAAVWRDALALGLTGFLVGNSIHALNHAADLGLGGHGRGDWISLVLLSAAVAAALLVRLRELGWVVGEVRGALVADLEPFVEQKTVLLTTYRTNRTPVRAPVSIAVDRDRAFIRTYERSGKVRRLRANPLVEIAPSTMRGTPTGPAVRARARKLTGDEWRRAGYLLRRKYPLLQGLLVPSMHHLLRAKWGRTMHYELVPAGPDGPTDPGPHD
jgi:PPOX class probable F420-dependent enzyme